MKRSAGCRCTRPIVPATRGNIVAAADAALSRLIEPAKTPDADPLIALSVAEAYAFRGEHDEALEWIEATRTPSRLREEMVVSPFLRVLHTDARWSSLLASADAH